MEPKHLIIRLLSIVMFCLIIRLIYGCKLKTGASWIWLVFGVGFLTLVFWPGAIDLAMKIVKVDSWIEVVFFFILISLLVINIHFSLVIANLTEMSKNLAQEITFLNKEIKSKKRFKTEYPADIFREN